MPLAVKVDVDTDLGTRQGVLPLAEICRRHEVPALFLFSLGPDNMGRSIFRVFQPGFLRKVLRTRVVANYGVRALLNGTLLPPPHLGRRHAAIMRRVKELGFEVGIHAYDHYRWQNHLHRWSLAQTRAQFAKAAVEFERVFGEKPRIAGAPGWQCSPHSLAVYDEWDLLCASDTRGRAPFLPDMGGRSFQTPQIPTTLPTLDELLGRPDFPLTRLRETYLQAMQSPGDHVLTVHAELEGLHYANFFEDLLHQARQAGLRFVSFGDWARQLRASRLPRCEIRLQTIEGRSGTLAWQNAW
jgi:peptidoglycan/xylan/chitin deacetylase (PgdA/CDA1 family)